jgi:hypothetical protein
MWLRRRSSIFWCCSSAPGSSTPGAEHGANSGLTE